MLIGSELPGHGIQIFDMRKVFSHPTSRLLRLSSRIPQLLTIDPASPVTFNNSVDLAGHVGFLPTGATHNVVVNEEKNYAVAVGTRPRTSACKSGLIFIDLTDVSNPKNMGCD